MWCLLAFSCVHTFVEDDSHRYTWSLPAHFAFLSYLRNLMTHNSQALLLIVLLLLPFAANTQQIAITFDDVPTHDTPLFRHAERAAKIREHLAAYKVSSAFFVITGSVTEQNASQLLAYTKAGHVLANHSHSHLSPSRISAAAYIRDLNKADSVMKSLPGAESWYRYPFLNEGPTREKRDSIRQALNVLGLSNGYVTVDNYDWFINGELVSALRNGKKIDYDRLRKVYIDHIINSILFYDSIGVAVLGRSPRHVLLLHENDLAALYLGDLLKTLRSKGWSFVSPAEAYRDEISDIVPDVLFNGQGRLGAIAYSKGIPARELVQASEDEDYLRKLLAEARVFY